MRCSGGRYGVAVAGLLALTAGSASASTFDYSGYSVVNEINVTIKGPVGQNGYFGSGQIDLIGTGLNAGQTLATWCIDVFDDLQNSDLYKVVSPSPTFTNNGDNGGALISHPTLGEIGALVHWGDSNLGADINGLGTGIVSAAVQLAIWSLEYPTDTFTSDNGNVNTLVGMLLTDAKGGLGAFTAFYGLDEVVDPGKNQGLVFEAGGNPEIGLPPVTATPLPSSWTMMLMGFAGFGFLTYRGRRTRFVAIAAA